MPGLIEDAIYSQKIEVLKHLMQQGLLIPATVIS